MRDTFYTDGRHLFDPTGKKVILRGINKMSVWDEIDPTGDTYFAEIRKTGANSVRIVWAITKDLKPGGAKTSLDTLDALITNARKNQLIPIVELHDATGDWDRLPELVDYWVQPEVVDIIQKHQAYLLLNIGNEVGDEKVTQSKFISGYKDAVKRLRKAGIHTPLVIDALDWGKDLEILNVTADKLTLPDPDKNLIFSVHLFWSKSSGVDANFIQSKLQEAVDHGYPLIVGEFSKYGGFAGNDEQGNPRSMCSEFGDIDYQTILKACDENEIGWLAWEWGPGNGRNDPLCVAMDMTLDGRFDSLKPGWATDVANSIKQASEKQDFFRLEPVPEVSVSLQTRIKTLNAVLSDPQHEKAVSAAMQESKGDFPKAMASLTEKKEVPTETLQKLELAHTLAAFTDDNVPVVKALASDPAVTSLRDVALLYNAEKLTALVDPKSLPENVVGSTEDEKKKNFVVTLQRKLYRAEPTAVLHKMVREEKIPIADKNVREGVASFLSNQPEFNISKTSIYTALKQPEAFKDIPLEHRSGVTENLKTIQRVQAISPIQEAVPVLMKANFLSASDVADKPESTFLRAMGPALGEETASQVYTRAINMNIRNTNALMTIREAMQGTSLEIIDGNQTKKERVAELQKSVDDKGIQLNLETLFGSIDYCECDDCLSVYSPASYFVDILQYLRNNDLGPIPNDPNSLPSDNPANKKGDKDITGTPLEMFFRRRPDLACLELTCENTFTVLPYVDLVNEVMESFVVHLDQYKADTTNVPKQAKLDVFNVTDEVTSELLAQPQHINYQAYCILKNAVYPFTLPYHQPIDVSRIWLKYMGTSRYELLDTFRTKTETCANVTLTDDQKKQLLNLHAYVLDRAVDAEFLGMTQEEYIILAREAFWPKAYFDLVLNPELITDDDYCQKIGVKPVPEYYGYRDPDITTEETDMLCTNDGCKGLTFVKEQFLPRTGILYADLVELLRTRSINPGYPQGKALVIMESIHSYYRYLQTKVVPDPKDPNNPARFDELIKFLNDLQKEVPAKDEPPKPDLCPQNKPDQCSPSIDYTDWVHCYFERIGKLIVLESGDGPQLPIVGRLFIKCTFDTGCQSPETLIGSLSRDGKIKEDAAGANQHVYAINLDGSVVPQDNSSPSLISDVGSGAVEILIKDFEGNPIGKIVNNSEPNDVLVDVRQESNKPFIWVVQDTCNIDKVRLTHLDGCPLTCEEYDRIQRFIRLWHKLGWTIDEVDQALIGLSTTPSTEPTKPDECDFVGFDAFKDECICEGDSDGGVCPNGNGDDKCPDEPIAPCISPEFLHQLVAIKKLLDLTGLPLDKLLTFWADIGIAGEKPLYASLFLTHNLLGIDKIFAPDVNGNYLTKSAKISEHLPVLMAALRMKADDVAAVKLDEPDALTLKNVSVLYHYSLLAKILHVRVKDLSEVIALLGDPFKSAQDAFGLLSDWGNMEDAGFTFRQLNYLIRNQDDPLHPLAPSDKTILKTTKTLYDGLNAIDNDNQDIPLDKKDMATADLIRAKVGLLLEQSVAEQIIGLLEGTAVYATNAPANQDIKIKETDTLAKKLKYSKTSASIQVTGILTDDEKTRAKALSSDSGWAKAIDRAGSKALQSFNDTMSGIIPGEAKTKLLAGDVNVPFDPNNPKASDANTAPEKRFLFLQYFMPFLRQRLSHKLTVDIMSSAASLSSEVTDVLLSSVLLTGDSQHAIDALQKIHQKPAESGNDWTGYLIPSADDNYQFFAKSLVDDNQPPGIIVDGTSISFTVQQEDPTNVWSADPEHLVPLKSGKLYQLVVTGQPIAGLQWKTSTSTRADIPSSALLPDYSTSGTKEVFIKLFKDALLVNGFSLTLDEVNYWQNHAADFDLFNFNEFDFHDVVDDSELKKAKLEHWRRMQAYASLRDKLPKTEKSLLDLFAWANKPDDASKLSEYIASVTLWKKEYIVSLIAPEHFDLKLEDFRNEINLVKLQKAIKVSDAIGTDIDRLFKWANPVSSFWVCHQIAEGIRATLRARYDQVDWEQVVKPLNDQLREDQKNALISYLLSQKELIDWDVVDADSLFEFFLIDVQMDPCMQTSRIKQAISSVQLFVQRCLLGLEKDHGVDTNDLDRGRWDWMQKYRVWEANRKVFLYPENWIKPELRDDKSPFYKELESELLQKDINSQTITDALKSYLFKVDEVANLKVVGLFEEQDDKGNPVKLHVFARTRNAPHFFYYRYFTDGDWYPWEKIQVDIPGYDLEMTYLFDWNKISEDPNAVSDNEKLRKFLTYKIFSPADPNAFDWLKTATIEKTETTIKVSPNPKKVPENSISLNLNNEKTKVFLEVIFFIDRSESIITNEFTVRMENSALNIYDDSNGRTTKLENGAYLIPVVGNKRLLIFFPQFTKKTAPNTVTMKPGNKFKDLGEQDISESVPVDYWELKLCWSEYQKNKWTQKQVSVDAVYDGPNDINPHFPSVDGYQFIPRVFADDKVIIEIHRPEIILDSSLTTGIEKDKPIGRFKFEGGQISVDSSSKGGEMNLPATDFHYVSDNTNTNAIIDNTIYSLQCIGEAAPSLLLAPPYFKDEITKVSLKTDVTFVNFYHSFAHQLLGTLAAKNLDDLFTIYSGITDNTTDPTKMADDAYGLNETDASGFAPYHELKRPYSLYNWEAAFHSPMQLVDRLLAAQQFDQALNMSHYILNPYAKGSDEKRFWQFPPFKIDAKNILEKLFLSLQPNQPDHSINEWRKNPFEPHVVARSRTSAYMKWVAMKYINILIAYGDYYFRQNTLETIPLAIQCYVLAAHVYGQRGQKIPKRGETKRETYYSLLDKWDAFSNAMVEMELIFPFSNQPSTSDVKNVNVGLPNIFGFASTLYFCIPNNPNLIALRDTIDDRLFKIRHCEDIQGVFRILPLFEPPIEPGLLVQAAAQGLSISSVLNDLNSPMPNYRFYYLLQKALELCSEVKALGNAFLSIKEKGDAEELSRLRAKHESSIHNLIMEVKKQQLDEAEKAHGALLQSRNGPVCRLQYYLNLMGEDLSKVPDSDTDFTELQNQYGDLLEDSGFKLNQHEREEMDKAGTARELQIGIGVIETLASIFHAIPLASVDVKPIGMGPGLSIGGSNFGNATQAMARSMQVYGNDLSYQSTNAGREAGHLHQFQDRVLQANIAGYEVKNIDKQILTQEIRKAIAQQEITNQQKQIDNAQEVEEFLLSKKYTKQELYLWMDGQIRTLYHQAYTLAYDLAKRAEKVFRFERGLPTSNFIQYGYWEDAYGGLFSGERLYIGLKQLEAAYQEERGHDFEVSKSISLRQVDPLTLIQLKETGKCEFALPEVLFDMDYPGHYMRRIKSVSLRIPCVVGPYTSLNCTLRLLEHKFRINAIAATKASDYIEKTDETDERFSTVNVPITSIAVSSLEDESGVFELNFHDERYLPFEGAGAISKWRIELPDPDKFKQFDYDTISDVIIKLRYTSIDGGDKLKGAASDSVMEYIKSAEQLSQEEGLFAAFDLKNEFPSEWYSANHPAQGADRVLTIDNLYEKLPIFTRGHSPAKIQATDIYLFASCPPSDKSCTLSTSSFTMTQNENEIPIADGQKIGSMMSVVAKELSGVTMESLQIQIKDKNAAIDKMWLLVRYVLT